MRENGSSDSSAAPYLLRGCTCTLYVAGYSVLTGAPKMGIMVSIFRH